MRMRRGSFAVGFVVLCIAGCGGSGGGNTTPPPQPAATPTFSPAAGTYTTVQSVSLATTTAGASIYYTIDGTTPTNTSTLYSAATPIQVSATTTIKAIAAEPPAYLNSSVASAAYTINLPVAATPTFSPAPGTYTSAQSVSLADTTAGASIYYTTDGSTPTNKSTLFVQGTPIAVSSTATINAIAIAPGFASSVVVSGTFTINLPVAATPTFSPLPGIFTAAQSVSLLDATTNAAIYYTTDGSMPTNASTLFNPATPIAVSSTTTINAIAIATGYLNSAEATGTYTLNGPAVSVVLSTNDESQLMATQPSINFALGSTADAGTNTVVVDPTQKYQTIEGFGAAFTDSAADLLINVEPPASLPGTLNDLFTTNGDGIGLSFMRIPMGASDIALSVYSYDDQTVGTTDLALADFSIAHDQAYIIPLIKQAKALNPQMKLMANPWSPPGWMKDPTSMNPVSMLGGTLLMTPANETAFANYFVKFIQAYKAAGVPIDYISLQNEPLNITTAYPSMGMSDTVQLALLQGYVLPAFTTNNITAKVFAYDHNWDTPSYPQTVLGGLTAPQLAQMAGTAWHGYGGAPGAQQLLQNQFPDLGNWETEHSGGTFTADQFTTDFLEITQVLRNSGKSFVKWSLALNEKLGPNLTQNAGLGGCNTCTPIITVNSTTGAVTKDIEFYTLGHYSKYVLPGAVRVYSSNTSNIASVAFQNTDGSMALIASNTTSASQTFQVQWGTESFSYTLPATSAATFTWTGTETGTTPPVTAKAEIQGSSFISESGLETETTGDSTGEYDLGYLTAGAYTVYENVDFGASGSISQVNVRSASGGNGGTAKFYLDSMTSAPIATVNLPVTGGWQTWTTVNGPVTGASGVHTLHVVFGGGGTTDSIANVNWFQFQ
jgi:glucosylceramidase